MDVQMRSKAPDNTNRSDRVPVALIAAAVLLGALASAKVMAFFKGRDRAKEVVGWALTQDHHDPNALRQHLDQAKETADALKKSNMFVKQPPKQHPVKQVDGILGREALISGKWYKVGEKIGDAKIVAIESTEARIEWDGKVQPFAPMKAGDKKPSAPEPKVAKPEGPGRPKAPPSGPPVQQVKVDKAPAPGADDALAWMGVSLSANIKEKLLEHWNKMSDEEKKEAKEKWNNMSDDQKQKAVEAMEQNM